MRTESEIERLAGVYQGYQRGSAAARWSTHNPGNRAMLAERSAAVRRLLKQQGWLPLAGRSILEIGCGGGAVLAGLLALGARPADLRGIDLLPDRVRAAQERYPALAIHEANAETLDLPSGSVDMVVVFTVFSSILDRAMAANVASEIERVLRSGGGVLWYDFRYNNPQNPHVRGISKIELATLFPSFDVRLRSITLLPPLARRLGRLTPPLYPLLARLPLLRTHYLGVLLKP